MTTLSISTCDLNINNTTIISDNNTDNIMNNFVDINNSHLETDPNDSTYTEEDATDNSQENKINVNIFRYNFHDNVMEQLTTFAKIHQHDDRKTYKDAWKQWLEDNEDIVSEEKIRLDELGYDGDIIDKMYKAARYYFRKKSNVKPDPKKRRKYISMEHEMITSMDNHIIRNRSNDNYTPSRGYSEFCTMNVELIRSEINRMIEIGISTEDISIKFKKTYKNRYFIITRNNFIN